MLSGALRKLSQHSSTAKPAVNHATRTTRTFSTTFRMSVSNKEWLVTIPDKPNALQKRLKARPSHLENVQPRVEVGQVVFGGAILGEQPSVDGTPDMKGSVMIFKADTEEEVRSLIENDEYTKQGVWDVEKAIIQPFRSAIRTAL